MAIIVSDRVKETAVASGLSDYRLSGPVDGFVSFESLFTGSLRNDTTYVCVTDGISWEVIEGAVFLGSRFPMPPGFNISLQRVISSSLGVNGLGDPIQINWPDLTNVEIYCTAPASKSVLEGVLRPEKLSPSSQDYILVEDATDGKIKKTTISSSNLSGLRIPMEYICIGGGGAGGAGFGAGGGAGGFTTNYPNSPIGRDPRKLFLELNKEYVVTVGVGQPPDTEKPESDTSAGRFISGASVETRSSVDVYAHPRPSDLDDDPIKNMLYSDGGGRGGNGVPYYVWVGQFDSSFNSYNSGLDGGSGGGGCSFSVGRRVGGVATGGSSTLVTIPETIISDFGVVQGNNGLGRSSISSGFIFSDGGGGSNSSPTGIISSLSVEQTATRVEQYPNVLNAFVSGRGGEGASVFVYGDGSNEGVSSQLVGNVMSCCRGGNGMFAPRTINAEGLEREVNKFPGKGYGGHGGIIGVYSYNDTPQVMSQFGSGYTGQPGIVIIRYESDIPLFTGGAVENRFDSIYHFFETSGRLIPIN